MSKIKESFKVDAGNAYALILRQNGDLYGIGNNGSGQIVYLTTRRIDQPIFLTGHVKAFAAGCDYSIYVTESGSVKLIGNGKYTERFSGFENAQDVEACSDRNVFFVEDALNRWYCFGDNRDGKIAGFKLECLYQFEEKTYKGSSTEGWGTEGAQEVFRKRGGVGVLDRNLSGRVKAEVMRSDIYRSLCVEYGEENLVLELNELGSGDYEWESLSWKSYLYTWKSRYAPRIMCKNHSIYKPLECSHDNRLHLEGRAGINNTQYIEKTVVVGSNTYILRKNDELSVLKHEDNKEIVLLGDVYDMSMTDNVVIISKTNGEVLFGMNAQVSVFYSANDLGHLRTFTM